MMMGGKLPVRCAIISESMAFNTRLLIQEVSKRPELYSRESEADSGVKLNLWREVGAAMYKDWDAVGKADIYDRMLELQRKWRSLRDAYRREIRIRKRGPNPRRRPYMYYKQLRRILPGPSPSEQAEDVNDDSDDVYKEDYDWIYSPEQQPDADPDGDMDPDAEVDPDADLDPDATYEEPPEISIKQEVGVELDPLVSTSGAGGSSTTSRKRRARTAATEPRQRRPRAEHNSPALQPMEEEVDSERLFLLSFASEMRQLSPSVRMWARAEIAAVMQEAVARDCGQSTSGGSYRSGHRATKAENRKK